MAAFVDIFSFQAVVLFLLLGSLVGLIAGLFGVGGGLITVPALIWGLPLVGVADIHATHMAVGTSLATIMITSISSIRAHHKRGGVIWREFRHLTPGILLGAWIGGMVAGMLAGPVLQRLFGLFVISIGLRMILRGGHDGVTREVANWVKGLVGVVIGLISAMVGIGGGSMTVPFLHATGVEMKRAVATSSACGLPIAVAGTASFVVSGWSEMQLPAGSSGYVYWPVALFIVVTSIPLAPVGAALAHCLPGAQLKRVFALLLLVIGGKLLIG
jgi:uncharacterized protein